MMESLISIILPIYNKESYIHKCIISILKQNYKNFELIIINDGSTDNSDKIIRETIKGHDNIKYYKYKNNGVSIARNYGIKHSIGKYILFIDADDWIEENYLETLVNNLKDEIDIYIWGLTKDINNKTEKIIPTKKGIYNQKSFLRLFVEDQYITQKGLYGYIPNKLIKSSVIKNNNILFNPNLKKLEDYDFYLSCYAHCMNFMCFEYTGYHYVCNTENSSNKLIKHINYISLIDIHYKCYTLLKEKEVLENYNKNIINEVIGQLTLSAYLEITPINKSYIKYLNKELYFRRFPLFALQSIQTKFKFLKKQILKQNTFFIYLYLNLRKLYIYIHKYFINYKEFINVNITHRL